MPTPSPIITARNAPTAVPRLWDLLRRPPAWAAAALGVLFFATLGFGYGGERIGELLGDTDDATRLIQVRRFLAGAGWYDLSLDRIGGAAPLISHWSRLIDLPLALLVRLFGLVLAPERAELAMRAVWPLLVLFALFVVVAREAGHRAGPTAAMLAVVFGATALTGLYRFAAGRIDHHNVMIVATVAGLLWFARSFEVPRRAYLAGAALGSGLVIGYEPLALIAPALALAVAAAVLNPGWLIAVRNVAQAIAVVLCFGVLVSVPPSQWVVAVCDRIAINLALMAVIGAGALTLVARYSAGWSLVHRAGAVAFAGVVAVAVYGALEPACLSGPFSQLDPAAQAVWLSGVIETQPIGVVLQQQPLVGLVFLAFAAIANLAGIGRVRRALTVETVVTAALLAAATVAGLVQMKFMPYATFLAVVVLACAIAQRDAIGTLSPTTSRLCAAGAANPVVLAVLLSPLAATLDNADSLANDATMAAREGCNETSVMRTLDTLPAGLIAADLNMGPYIVAASHHAALAAPYHRIGRQIADSGRLFAAEPLAAEAVLRSWRVQYVLLCAPVLPSGATAQRNDKIKPESLEGRLRAGQTPAFLERVTLPGQDRGLQVWRLRQPM